MSLTTKLCLGFGFALLLQVLQMLLSGHYTNLMQSAVKNVTASVEAGQVAERALDTASLLKKCLLEVREGRESTLDVVAVYRQELEERRRQLYTFPMAGATIADALIKIDEATREANEEFLNLGKALAEKPADKEQIADACELLEEPIELMMEGFARLRIDLRQAIDAGLREEREVHDLPKQASSLIAAIGALLLGAFTFWYSRQVARPIREARERLEAEVEKRTEDLSHTVVQLENEAEKTSRLQRELLDASRQAGKAEIATGVLHNVGNTLNSVVVSVQTLQSELRSSRRPLLKKTSDLLEAHRDDLGHFLTADRRGQLLPDMIRELAANFDAESRSFDAELNSLSDHVSHIRTIVSTQQDHATVVGAEEAICVQELIREMLTMMQASVTVDLELDELPPTYLDRSRTLQILTNLISNAEAALFDAATPEPRITVRLREVGAAFELAVIDNGPGVAAENRDRIFAHGFTTKVDGHGFGLHHSANAAAEMGGALTCDQAGQGATFRLRLPLRPVALAQ